MHINRTLIFTDTERPIVRDYIAKTCYPESTKNAVLKVFDKTTGFEIKHVIDDGRYLDGICIETGRSGSVYYSLEGFRQAIRHTAVFNGKPIPHNLTAGVYMSNTKPTYHLAIIAQPYLNFILDGTKRIESRFSKVKSAPFGKIKTGDIVYMKIPSGPVLGQFTVAKVETFENLQEQQKIEIYEKHFNSIFVVDWLASSMPDKWVQSKHATLIHIRDVKRYPSAIYIPKKDRRPWVVMD